MLYAVCILLALCAGCGQKGPLTLPGPSIRAPSSRGRCSAGDPDGRKPGRRRTRPRRNPRTLAPALSRHRMKLVLVDGSSYLYRAFHALPPLANSKGGADGCGVRRAHMLGSSSGTTLPQANRRRVRRAGRDIPRRAVAEYKANRRRWPTNSVANRTAPGSGRRTGPATSGVSRELKRTT